MTPLKASVAPADDRARQGALKTLLFLRRKIQVAAENAANYAHVHEDYRSSAVNLLSYLALRRHDIRLLQTQLSELGLSSLGRCERNVTRSVDQVIDVLQQLTGATEDSRALAQRDNAPISTTSLQDHGKALFGDPPRDRAVRIMVTMPTEAADDYAMVESMLAAGMNCQRINCAHDGPEVWGRMIEHLHKASQKLGKPCEVVMDLAGPKLRTGPIAARPPVMKIRPERDKKGKVRAPARVYLSAHEIDENCLQVPCKWLMGLEVGDVLSLRDARDSKRQMLVTDCDESGCWVEMHKTAYIVPGTVLKLKNAKGRKPHARVVAVPSKPCSIKLREGDHLVLVHGNQEGQPALLDEHAHVISPARISCNSNAVFNAAAADPIWFDDGKIGGVVLSTSQDEMQISIHHAPDGVKLKADKGINLPATDLKLGALSDDDLFALEFAAQHADIVELSFVNSANDVNALMTELKRLDALRLGVVLKIETQRGFESLPELLIAGMATSRLGVMIARGDLAVETGFERTAELQEEMLCLCEAAHVPVIWATQVLETLAKTGAPTRAEITDAAMGVRAECVMLNKGRHILKAIKTLDDLLKRMQHHHDKKRDMMTKLHVASSPRLSP
ncbi:pyruvate kinase [Pseudomonas huanghezhanensis]|uniref:pyruvate kinase n=1 Tax=Pseudomonas huanghezhanensis TaxID=3002903 RepID=UPI0022857217|nr:pyruvate kinase [Pseudomonas sp. BSw22131]